MSRILAVDPGLRQSAWLLLVDGLPEQFSIDTNEVVADILRLGLPPADIVVIEEIQSYGMAVGRDVFETVWWSGRFAEAAAAAGQSQVRLSRVAVKSFLCGTPAAKDANVRTALIDRFGGAEVAIGRKSSPGPLHGISRDVWAALGVAVTWAAIGDVRPGRTAA